MNSFEHLCINFTNERLQQFFNRQVFTCEAEEYSAEGLDSDGQWTRLMGACTLPALSLLEGEPGKGMGIFGVVNDRSRCGFEESSGGSALADTIAASSAGHPAFCRGGGKEAGRVFGVKHFAGEVFYEAAQFVRKNASAHRPDIVAFLREKGGGFIREVLAEDKEAEEKTDGIAVDSKGGKKGPRRKLFGRTLISVFQQELNELCTALEARSCRHVRCLRPNDEQAPLVFDDGSMLRQCRYSGLLEATRIRRQGYAHRRPLRAFAARYAMLLNSREARRAARHVPPAAAAAACTAICQAATSDVVDPEDARIGKTKVFLREGALHWFENARLSVASGIVVGQLRGLRQRRSFLRLRAAALRVQTNVRGFLGRLRFVRLWHERRAEEERAAAAHEILVRRSAGALQRAWRHYVSQQLVRLQAERARLDALRVREAAREAELALEEQRRLEVEQYRMEVELRRLEEQRLEEERRDLEEQQRFQEARLEEEREALQQLREQQRFQEQVVREQERREQERQERKEQEDRLARSRLRLQEKKLQFKLEQEQDDPLTVTVATTDNLIGTSFTDNLIGTAATDNLVSTAVLAEGVFSAGAASATTFAATQEVQERARRASPTRTRVSSVTLRPSSRTRTSTATVGAVSIRTLPLTARSPFAASPDSTPIMAYRGLSPMPKVPTPRTLHRRFQQAEGIHHVAQQHLRRSVQENAELGDGSSATVLASGASGETRYYEQPPRMSRHPSLPRSAVAPLTVSSIAVPAGVATAYAFRGEAGTPLRGHGEPLMRSNSARAVFARATSPRMECFRSPMRGKPAPLWPATSYSWTPRSQSCGRPAISYEAYTSNSYNPEEHGATPFAARRGTTVTTWRRAASPMGYPTVISTATPSLPTAQPSAVASVAVPAASVPKWAWQTRPNLGTDEKVAPGTPKHVVVLRGIPTPSRARARSPLKTVYATPSTVAAWETAGSSVVIPAATAKVNAVPCLAASPGGSPPTPAMMGQARVVTLAEWTEADALPLAGRSYSLRGGSASRCVSPMVLRS
mmetsp:Transcript_9545/g.20941  ORF Transcript_9545/g.20941 Transcript_9545/m.20941 type:complete len:1035 (+) Transcript_9545:2-3106(+)